MVQDSYLLRFWRTPQGEEWRITLITVSSCASEQHFISVADLFDHLYGIYQSPAVLAHEAPNKAAEDDSQP